MRRALWAGGLARKALQRPRRRQWVADSMREPSCRGKRAVGLRQGGVGSVERSAGGSLARAWLSQPYALVRKGCKCVCAGGWEGRAWRQIVQLRVVGPRSARRVALLRKQLASTVAAGICDAILPHKRRCPLHSISAPIQPSKHSCDRPHGAMASITLRKLDAGAAPPPRTASSRRRARTRHDRARISHSCIWTHENH